MTDRWETVVDAFRYASKYFLHELFNALSSSSKSEMWLRRQLRDAVKKDFKSLLAFTKDRESAEILINNLYACTQPDAPPSSHEVAANLLKEGHIYITQCANRFTTPKNGASPSFIEILVSRLEKSPSKKAREIVAWMENINPILQPRHLYLASMNPNDDKSLSCQPATQEIRHTAGEGGGVVDRFTLNNFSLIKE